MIDILATYDSGWWGVIQINLLVVAKCIIIMINEIIFATIAGVCHLSQIIKVFILPQTFN